MKNIFLLATGLVMTGFCNIMAQTVKIPLTLNQWDTQGAEVSLETYMDKESLLLKSGFISPKNVDFQDGIIEAYISFPQQRGFPGFAFRLQDPANFENFYMRPHQSGNPDATQYTPIFNGQAGWQLYHGEGYSKAFTFKFNQWHHIKIEVHGLQAEIYIDDMQNPLIKATELKREPKTGKIGLISGGLPVRIADLQYTPKQASRPEPKPVPVSGTGGIITQWQVSNVINRTLFEKKQLLIKDITEKLTWATQNSEPSGTINLAKFIQPTDTFKTIVAKVSIESTSEQVKEMSFGFSDYVIVYLNGKALYSGGDNFMSRDYRFLGTIGYFDKLFLPLKKGRNELWFVVSEDFGGWGVKAKFENMDNISLK